MKQKKHAYPPKAGGATPQTNELLASFCTRYKNRQSCVPPGCLENVKNCKKNQKHDVTMQGLCATMPRAAQNFTSTCLRGRHVCAIVAPISVNWNQYEWFEHLWLCTESKMWVVSQQRCEMCQKYQ
eukprot:6342401-Amphidinium_carterae.1